MKFDACQAIFGHERHRYYEEDHPVVSSGSVFRGYRDCYFDKTLLDSGLGWTCPCFLRSSDPMYMYLILCIPTYAI